MFVNTESAWQIFQSRQRPDARVFQEVAVGIVEVDRRSRHPREHDGFMRGRKWSGPFTIFA
jgi:hypothetical protein